MSYSAAAIPKKIPAIANQGALSNFSSNQPSAQYPRRIETTNCIPIALQRAATVWRRLSRFRAFSSSRRLDALEFGSVITERVGDEGRERTTPRDHRSRAT